MPSYLLSDLSDLVLVRNFGTLLGQERGVSAEMLAHLAEIDERRLYLPAGHDSMLSYLVQDWDVSEDSALSLIRAGRTARKFPAIFGALADGRLHLTAVILLTPHLTAETAAELLTAAANKSKAEIKRLLAQRYPRPDVPTRVEATPRSAQNDQGRLGQVQACETKLGLDPVEVLPRPRVEPLSAQTYGVQFTMDQAMHDDLRHAQALLGHRNLDERQVFGLALRALIPQLEKRKFAATENPRPKQRATKSARHIPAHVKRAVWERDQGQCAFTSEVGRRCAATHRLEFDHAEPVARGGRATVDGIRLRCRAHNQFEAERMFGEEFMRHKREQARDAAEARATAEALTQEAARKVAADASAQAAAMEQDVVPWLRQLGFRAGEAQAAAKLCESIPDAPLEERVRVALSFFHPRVSTYRPATGSVGTAA
jgi:5-methylcytosine-specific restriction endonuclease McrA